MDGLDAFFFALFYNMGPINIFVVITGPNPQRALNLLYCVTSLWIISNADQCLYEQPCTVQWSGRSCPNRSLTSNYGQTA